MDLILWRHAEAEEDAPDGDDLARALTPRGEKEAARMGNWLDKRLPEGARVLSSPATRCEQTALALGRKYKLRAELAPGAQPDDLLHLAHWPDGKHPVVLVGHQPVLGHTIAQVLRLPEDQEVSVRKGGVWWLRARVREERVQVVVMAVMPPDLA